MIRCTCKQNKNKFKKRKETKMENIMNTNEVIVENTEKEMDTTMNTETTATEMTDEQVLDIIKEEKNFDFDNLERYDKRSLPWSVKQMVASMIKGTARFDNTVQRTLVWNDEKKSRLIHTAILNLPCPPLYANVYSNPETGKKVYDFLDGKQRSHAFKEFLNDEFELTEVPVLTFTDGKELNINGYKFSELPEEAALGVTIFARESDLSLFETNLRVRKNAAARSNAASTNKIDTVFDFISYKYIVN